MLQATGSTGRTRHHAGAIWCFALTDTGPSLDPNDTANPTLLEARDALLAAALGSW